MAPTFEPPGPGQWAIDRSHYPSGVTPISQWLLTKGIEQGVAQVFEELGVPAAGFDVRFVNGFMYTRLRPLIGGNSKPRKPPPLPIMKLVTRLHPEFRKRNAAAIASLRDHPSRQVVRRWETELQPRLAQTNAAFQAVDPQASSDADLQEHISTLLDQLAKNFALHFWLHGHDLGPIARYLHASLRWGLDPIVAISALAGASPSTARPLAVLCRLREMLESQPTPVATLGELHASSTQAANLIDDYFEFQGHILVTGYDLDARTLIEVPHAVLNSIRSAVPVPMHNADSVAGELRNQLDAADRPDFDLHLADAREVMDMRDENGPLTIEWPMGLLRRALLEAGRRLTTLGAISSAEHLFELTAVEVRSLFDGSIPAAAVLSERADKRAAQGRLSPPSMLGPAEPDPPLDALPKALAELIETTRVATKYLGLDQRPGTSNALKGAGIGTTRYVGTARVASSADQALDQLEPGDVLIVRATSPAFNAVLSIAGAVVTADGGVLSHAAVLSRELAIPAVIGAPGALDIADGATVEVDPVAGLVRVFNV